VGCLIVTPGCSRQARQARHLERAGRQFQAERYREASIEYMNVLGTDPTNRVALRGLGLALFQVGEMRAAIPCLLKAEEADPGDAEVRLKLGSLYLLMGLREKARERAEAVLRQETGHLDALALYAASAGPRETDEAIARLLPHAARHAGQARFQVALATLYAGRGDVEKAESLYRDALERLPQSWELHLARADLYARKRDLVRAGESYRAAAGLAPVTSLAPVKWARFCESEGRLDEARAILDGVLREAPDSGAAVMARAELALRDRDPALAAGLLEGFLKAEPSNVEAFLLLQRVKLAQGKVDEAIAGYQKVVTAFPKAAQGHYLLALAWLQKGEARKAIAGCERAMELEADHLDALRLMAELHIRAGQPDQALSAVRPYLARHPEDVSLLGVVGAAQGARKDHVQAAATYREMIRKMPTNPRGPYLLGLALRKLGREEEAAASFEAALKLDPAFLEPLDQVAGLLAARGGRWADGARRIEQQIAVVPESAAHSYLLGTYLSRMRDWEGAERAFLKAVQQRPELTAAYVGLSHVYARTRRVDEALGKLDAALALRSNDVASLMMKALILTGRNRSAEAAEAYRQILALNPTFVPALNNLACLSLESPAMREQAYEWARQARSLEPRDPRVADTLGWILYLKGDYQWALTLLQEALESLGAEPEVQYHVGLCQAALGNEDKARAACAKALELAGDFPGAREAKALLDILSAGDSLQERNGAGEVEAFLAAHSDSPLALVKGAAYYQRTGDAGRARALFEKALAVHKGFVPALVGLARLWAGPLGKPDRALAYAKQAREAAPGDAEVALVLATLAFQGGDFQWAQSLLAEGAGRTAGTPESLFLLGLIQYAQGRTDEATNRVAQALQSGTGFPSAGDARRFMERAGNPGAALRDVPESALLAPLSVENLPLLMQAAADHERSGETGKARFLYEAAVAKYPAFIPAYRRLAALLMGRESISEPEFKRLVKARELLPADPVVARSLGQAAYLRGQYEWAVDLLQESARQYPDAAEVFYYLGLGQQRLKHADAARKALARGLELDPGSRLAPLARQGLEGNP
jgi:tetratricopeptide (TPR) repeat protein